MAYTTSRGTMPTTIRSNGSTRATISSSDNEYRITQKVKYGTSAAGTFESLYQTASGYPLLIEDLKNITIRNIGMVPVELRFTVRDWTNGTPDANAGSSTYLSYILAVGDYMYLPNIKCVGFSTSTSAGSAYVLDNKNPADINSGYLLQSSGSTLGANLEDSDTTVTVNASTHPFYVGDLIQVGLDTATTTRQEVMRVTAISGDTLTVDRALHGTSKADKDSQTNGTNGAVSGATINLPFFNTTGNTNHYNGFSTAQTDSNGVFHIYNFFGYGRYTSAIAGGIVPGTLSGKFFNPGYQELGLSNITSSTNSGLVASTEYGFDITVDGSGNMNSGEMKFTTDSSNVNFGGTNGIISKIQSVLDARYYAVDSDIFQEKVTIGIVNGDIRFTSGQRLSTSAILLAAPSAGQTTPFGVGRFPAIATVEAPVVAKLPDDTIIDKVSGVQNKNSGAFFYDDGFGNITGIASGSINYTTGEFSLTSAPANSHFVVSANYGSALSGGTKLQSGNANSIMEIEARSTNYKIDGNIEFIGYE